MIPLDALLERAEGAFARYGVRSRDRFDIPAPIVGLNHRYFVHERAAGANWLLAGPSYCQVWWMAGAGVGTALAAADLAPKVVQEPSRWGAEYERYIRRVVGIHDTFDYFALAGRPEVSRPRLCDRMVSGPGGLVTAYGRLRGRRRGRPVSAGEGSATYRLQDGRIVEIWTTRRNYVLIFVPYLRYRRGLVLMLLHLRLWKKLTRQHELSAGSRSLPTT